MIRLLIVTALMVALAVVIERFVPPGWFDVIGDAATEWAEPVFSPLLTLLSKRAFVNVASALMLLAAFVVMGSHHFGHARPDLARLKRLRAAIRALPQPGQGGASPEEALSALGAQLTKAHAFVGRFDEYMRERATHGRIPNEPFGRRILSVDWARERPGRALYAAMPGYFTTFGLIATFAGLVAALYFASRGFRSGTAAEAQAAIVQLLNASSFKFLTSVAALFSAFLISIFLRISDAKLRASAQRTAAQIDQYLRGWTANDRYISPDARIDALTAAVAQLTRIMADRLPGEGRTESGAAR